MDDRRNCSFQIHHPKKSFVVVAESPEMKRVWLRDINEARAAGRKSAERETQLGVIARLKLESNRVMALLEGKAPDLRPASGEAGPQGGDALGLLGSPERGAGGGRGFGFGGASLDQSGGLPQGQGQAQAQTQAALRARGTGSNVSVSLSSAAAAGGDGAGAQPSSAGGNAERLQDVELELAFADGLRALQRLLRPPPQTQQPGAASPAQVQGQGQGGAPGAVAMPLQSPPAGALPVAGASVVVETKALAGLIGLFLQYRDGDYSHYDHHPLAAVAALSAEGGPEEDPLPALVAAGQQAWKAHAGLSQTAAMNQFLHVLEGVAPGWREGAVSLLSPLSVAPAGVGEDGGAAVGASGMGGKGGKTPRGAAKK